VNARDELAELIFTTRGDTTQVEFAAHFGIQGNQVSRWENGRAIPGKCHAAKIAALAGVPKERIESLIEAAGQEASALHQAKTDELLAAIMAALDALDAGQQEILTILQRRDGPTSL
jgi:transcriptional regulator with XRE-family HTH domain